MMIAREPWPQVWLFCFEDWRKRKFEDWRKRKKEEEKEEAEPDRISTRSSLGSARYLLSLRVPVNSRWTLSTV
jgi:hypothetical protein